MFQDLNLTYAHDKGDKYDDDFNDDDDDHMLKSLSNKTLWYLKYLTFWVIYRPFAVFQPVEFLNLKLGAIYEYQQSDSETIPDEKKLILSPAHLQDWLFRQLH
jgi:hypothetical protein